MACWNHPFEVARIGSTNQREFGTRNREHGERDEDIIKENGVGGLFPDCSRIGLGIWQTLFMVTGAKILKEELKERVC